MAQQVSAGSSPVAPIAADTAQRLKDYSLGTQPQRNVALPVGQHWDSSVARIIFETDGKRVVKYRAGRGPQVEYVEGCS